MNISSIVVQTRPEFLNEVLEKLKASPLCDYHFHDEKGRIIITIEGEGIEEEMAKLREIEKIPHIISADMQMSYSEEELEAEKEKLEKIGSVPEMLNDETLRAEDIVYNGDLKKKL